MPGTKQYRSSKGGRFTTKEKNDQDPNTHQAETRKDWVEAQKKAKK